MVEKKVPVGQQQLPDWLKIYGFEKFMGGLEVMNLPIDRKYQVASQVSQLLSQHPTTMLQFSPEQLVNQFINMGDAVVIWDQKKDQLIGFAKNYLWPGRNEQNQLLYEFGSWSVFEEYAGNGYGYRLALLGSQTAKAKDANSQLVAVCSVENPKSIVMLKKLGAINIAKPSNLQILLGEGKAQVQILDMSNLDFHL